MASKKVLRTKTRARGIDKVNGGKLVHQSLGNDRVAVDKKDDEPSPTKKAKEKFRRPAQRR